MERSRGEIVAFSDANSLWEPDAARELVGAFEDPHVGYACGQVRFVQAAAADGARAPNQEGVYWRYELAVRALESRLSSITAGNGAHLRHPARVLPGRRPDHGPRPVAAVQHRQARPARRVRARRARRPRRWSRRSAGEFARKRRMMSHTWPIVAARRHALPARLPARLRADDPLAPAAALQHARPARARAGRQHRRSSRSAGWAALYIVTLALQLALLLAAALAGVLPLRPLLIARYYVLTTASLAAGLWDWLRHGTDAAWEVGRGNALTALRPLPQSRPVLRRAVDIVVSATALAFASPVLAVAAARDPPGVPRPDRSTASAAAACTATSSTC